MGVNEIFKTEFRGYNKKEVADYILSLNNQMESLKSELDNAESQLIKYQDELEETKPQEQSPRELTEQELDQIRDQIRAELEPKLTKDISEKLEQKYKAVIEQCVAEDKQKYEVYREKAEMYDSQKEIITELMIKAKSDATEMYSDAEKKSSELLNETFDKYTKMQSDFEQMKSNVLASKTEVDTKIANIQRHLNDFAQHLDFMLRDIESTGEHFKENM